MVSISPDPSSTERAKGLFRWSILYLFGICLLLILVANQTRHCWMPG